MLRRPIRNGLRLLCLAALMSVAAMAAASEYHGQVTFGGLPVPGAVLSATQGEKNFTATTDPQGFYSFPNLSDGNWTIEIQMTGFATLKQGVAIGPNTAAGKWELKLLPLDQIKAEISQPPASQTGAVAPGLSPAHSDTGATPGATNPGAGLKPGATSGAQHSVASSNAATKPGSAAQENQNAKAEAPDGSLRQRAEDGFLVNGSVNNAATSPFALSQAFGNARNGGKALVNGGLAIIYDNSALDARPFSLSGQNTPKPEYNRITGVAALGGRIHIPHLIRRGPNFFVLYQWQRYVNDSTQSALVPDAAERAGDFSQALDALGQPAQIFNPATGLPFPTNTIPTALISPQAQALLNYYPLPTFTGNSRYNYQIPIDANTHQDMIQSRLDESINPRNQLYGRFNYQSTRTATPNLFGFLDTTSARGTDADGNWAHRFSSYYMTLGYRFSRLSTRVTPYWQNRANVSGDAGIMGNDQDPMNWGPPALAFSSGIAGLTDGQSSFNRNQTNAWSASVLHNRNRHNLEFGGEFRRQQFNYLSQQNPRGALTFTGAATQSSGAGSGTGFDFADFLLGIPDTSSIAFGNADKYFRESVSAAYFKDDWRIRPEFTLNAGVRWEYGAPMTELYDRLVNLDIASGFTAASPVLAGSPTGPLTAEHYPNSLVRPDKHLVEPRIGFAWRPLSGSSLLIRGGYGIYSDTSVYQTIAQQMAQQSPLSKSLSVLNSPGCPLTLASPFNPCSAITQDTFAIDPNFRVGYAQVWTMSLQRDLPGSLQLLATYSGTKGTRGVQEFLPNTYPSGAVNPCPACPAGFAYLTSNGNLERESGQVQLRRRLHNGFTASVMYTFAKSIDDDASVGGGGAILPQTFGGPSGSSAGSGGSPPTPAVAQNWLNLDGERGLSTFDQRHLLNLQAQYTTGMGIGGRTLLSGWRGTAFKEWTATTQITVGSGLPQTPVYFAAVPGTGVTGSIRPDSTGAGVYAAPAGLNLNPAAFTAPAAGQWGTAGRDSIVGPAQFSLNTSLGRTFRLDKYTLDLRIDSTNFLNHPTFTAWYTTLNNAQFGLPSAVNAMRSLQATLRFRF